MPRAASLALLVVAGLVYASTLLGFPPEGTKGAGSPYTYTFDGAPAGPQSAYHMPDMDVQVHTRAMQHTPDSVEFMDAQHGSACDAPPATHSLSTAEMTVFRCRDHVMTALRADDYGLIYLTPNRMLDWSDGEATLSIDVSTLRTSYRDWWDIWLTEWDAQLAAPLHDGVDLQGVPLGDFLHIDGEKQEKSFHWRNDNNYFNYSSTEWEAASPTQRDAFVLTIRKNGTFDFCKPDESICFAKNEPHGLNITQAVVQIGHHSYTPRKDPQYCDYCDQVENTWHWDNLAMSDSVPFTIIRANERYQSKSGTFTFDTPAPANSYLRFTAIGNVTINGEPAQIQPGTRQNTGGGHFSSYWHPIPAGTTSVQYSATSTGSGTMMKDVSIFSESTSGGGGGATQPTNTPVPPTNTPANPTNTPVDSTDAPANPTNTPVAPTSTAVPNDPVPPVDHAPQTGSRVHWQGQDWYLHGVNLPWYNWSCDFGCLGNGGVSSSGVRNAIDAGLQDAAEAGMPNIRWWMFPGDPWQIETSGDGTPTGINDAVYTDIDAALALAEKHDVYYTFVLFSGPEAIDRDWMTNSNQRSALANVIGSELFRRYANHPRILSWEVFNEPEFKIWSGEFSQTEVVETVKAIAARANAETSSHITVGSAHLDGLEMWVGAGLDYYQAHWYDYMGSGNWCARCRTYADVQAEFGLDAPLVIGEYYGAPNVDALARLEDWYDLGYAGGWAWSLLFDRTQDKMDVDLNAARTFADQHSDVGPQESGSNPPPTATPTRTTVPATATPTRTTVPATATPTGTSVPATPTPTKPSATATATPGSGSAAISGTVRLQSRPSNQGASVTLMPGNKKVTTNSTGRFTVTGVAPGTYRIEATFGGYLGSQRTVVVNGSRTVTVAPTTLLGGDANDDGSISISDISMIVSDYGGLPRSGFTDVNGSGRVEISDLSIAISNYSLSEWLGW